MTKQVDHINLHTMMTSTSLPLHNHPGIKKLLRQSAVSATMTPVHGTGWFLNLRSWQLTTPQGMHINLTPNEYSFVTLLVNAEGTPVRRDTIAEKLYARYDYHTSRSLDSLVRRLRTKIKNAGDNSAPIKTAHAIGYLFTAPVTTSQPRQPVIDFVI